MNRRDCYGELGHVFRVGRELCDCGEMTLTGGFMQSTSKTVVGHVLRDDQGDYADQCEVEDRAAQRRVVVEVVAFGILMFIVAGILLALATIARWR